MKYPITKLLAKSFRQDHDLFAQAFHLGEVVLLVTQPLEQLLLDRQTTVVR